MSGERTTTVSLYRDETPREDVAVARDKLDEKILYSSVP